MRLAFFQPDIPQNLGAAIRLCACLAVELEVIEPCGFPLDARELRRVAMDYGALARITRRASWTAFLAAPARAEGRLVLMTTRADGSLYNFAFSPGDTLLMGSESAGAPDWVHGAAQARLLIPLAPGARSFNLTVASAIALSEALRQTGGLPERS
jgi:tRNA (cytidine/uridine-2'-O-)-methyltransferase